jgi:hypothetical protein
MTASVKGSSIHNSHGTNPMGKINAAWHKAHRMPPRATLDQRVEWHIEHLKACACRTDLPATIRSELRRRGIRLSSLRVRTLPG